MNRKFKSTLGFALLIIGIYMMEQSNYFEIALSCLLIGSFMIGVIIFNEKK